jgi:hypothetical protein
MFARRFGTLSLVAVTLFTVRPVAAQMVMWDTPSFLGPLPADDIGVYAFRPDFGDWGFAGIWRQSGNVNLGARVGLGGAPGARIVLVGAELSQPLRLFGPATPLEVSGTLGLGAGFNSVTSLRVPLGATVGLVLPIGGARLTPYVHPRLAFDLHAWDANNGERTETELNVPVDLGADMQIGASFVVRFGASLDRGDTVIGAGVALRIPRRVEVR